MMNRYLIAALLFVAWVNEYAEAEDGVSWRLAQERKERISDVRYDLSFTIPESEDETIEVMEVVCFRFSGQGDVVMDFRESGSLIHSVTVNGHKSDAMVADDHLTIPGGQIRKGVNRIELQFTAGTQSLNRREDYLYTLFVPDRARTAFPCFDQPNMKAVFRLTLDIPSRWQAVANGPVKKEETKGERKRIRFADTEPLPTYLFAFAAGDFRYTEQTFARHRIGAYYRDIDTAKVCQIPEILRQVNHSIEWLEEYTGVEYPFRKYDLVILPGFQFGGMEHAGATFYNDTRLFVPSKPTSEDFLTRAKLIAHETAHMWFGDYVTMNWFDDVWTKEVFANYFAARITEPMFTEIDHGVNFYREFQCPAMGQDRTEGRTSIRQPLDNLRNAGLIYNDIIYNKAPVMMRKLVSLMGEEAFHNGIRKYMKRFAYGNATWGELIEILDGESERDIAVFSRVWVDSTYWPRRKATTYRDALDAEYYGFTEMTEEQIDSLTERMPATSAGAMAGMMTLYENYLNHNIEAGRFIRMMMKIAVSDSSDELLTLRAIENMAEPLREMPEFAARVLRLSQSHRLPAARTKALRLLTAVPTTDEVTDSLFVIWESGSSPYLSEKDQMTMAYEMAIRKPDKSSYILETQRKRITNRDLLREFDFIARACNPSAVYRDSLFMSLQEPANRRIEPWTGMLLGYLNHPLRQSDAVKYIKPALEWLPEIQRTGDIFFPGRWCNALLSGHRSEEALREVKLFLSANKEMNPLLRNKILAAMYYLGRIN